MRLLFLTISCMGIAKLCVGGASVLEVVDAVKKITGKEFKVTLAGRRSGDSARLVGSSEKFKRILGWKPEYSDIDTIIIYAWYWHEHKRY